MPREILLFGVPFIASFVASMLVAPLIIWMLRRGKAGQTIQEDGPESHLSKAGTPTMGGIIIVIGILGSLAATLLARAYSPHYSYYLSEMGIYKGLFYPPSVWLFAVLALVLGYAILGAIDDYLTIRPIGGVRGIASKPKALLQVLMALVFVLWLRHTFFEPGLWVGGTRLFLGEWYWVFAALFIAGMANFVNITDGLDGLVSGLVGIVVVAFLLSVLTAMPEYAYRQTIALSPLLMAVAGACLAFLWFNANPAKVFMGDTGSLALGALLPAVAIVMHKEILMIVLGLVFVLDGFSTIIQWAVFKYTRILTGTGRRVFLKSPVHHHFELMGWPEQTVVVRFWICGVIAAMLGYAGVTLGWW